MTDPLWILQYEGPTWREQGEEWTNFAGRPQAREATKVDILSAVLDLPGVETVFVEFNTELRSYSVDGAALTDGTYAIIPLPEDPS